MTVDELNEAGWQDARLCLGSALATWQPIEVALFHVCACACEAGDTSAFSGAFHQIQTFSSRLKMTDAAIRYGRASEEKKNVWTKLSERLEKAGARRNLFVHGTLEFISDNGKPHEYMVLKNMQNPAIVETTDRKPIGMKLGDMLEAMKTFIEVRAELVAFEKSLIEELQYRPDARGRFDPIQMK